MLDMKHGVSQPIMVKPHSCPEDTVVDTAGAGGKWFILSGGIPCSAQGSPLYGNIQGAIGEVSRGHSRERVDPEGPNRRVMVDTGVSISWRSRNFLLNG